MKENKKCSFAHCFEGRNPHRCASCCHCGIMVLSSFTFKEKKEQLCGRTIHANGPVTCANEMPCKIHLPNNSGQISSKLEVPPTVEGEKTARPLFNLTYKGEEKKCVTDAKTYLSNPPQTKCRYCGRFWFIGEPTPICKNVEINTVFPVHPPQNDDWREIIQEECHLDEIGIVFTKEKDGLYCNIDHMGGEIRFKLNFISLEKEKSRQEGKQEVLEVIMDMGKRYEWDNQVMTDIRNAFFGLLNNKEK